MLSSYMISENIAQKQHFKCKQFFCKNTQALRGTLHISNFLEENNELFFPASDGNRVDDNTSLIPDLIAPRPSTCLGW